MSAAQGTAGTRSKTIKKILLGVAVTLVLAVVGGGVVWTTTCPCETMPGFVLLGDSPDAPVTDWSFTNEIEEIFVETRAWYRLPHSTTIWCVELGGDLYVGSYGDEQKTWEKNLVPEPRARLAIAGKLYEVTLQQVEDPGRVEALDAAYAQKYDMADAFGDEIPTWWYYKVNARS